MSIDPSNPVVALCAAGMRVEGTPNEARRLFEEAWAARRDDYEACIAAHFLARHQPTPVDALHWNTVAVQHAEAVRDDRAGEFLASMYLNLANSLLETGDREEAVRWAASAAARVEVLPLAGYRDFVTRGIRSLEARLHPALADRPFNEEL